MERFSQYVVKYVGLLGFVHFWTTTDGNLCFVHPRDPGQTEIFVSPSMTSCDAARSVLDRARRIAGWHTPPEEYGVSLTGQVVDALRERELTRLERMMTRLPQGGRANRGTGQVRHCAGSR